jgi:hypothetical protein
VEAGETCGEPNHDTCAAGVPCIECGCGAPTTVPSIVGLDLESATGALTAAGLVTGRITKSTATNIPAVAILAQSPAGGATARAGTAVDLTVTYPPDPGAFLAYDIPPVESVESALAYYEAIDPTGEKTTLAAWKAANRFGAPNGIDASAVYFNDFDLGFGRQMYMRLDNEGVAYYVSNYPTVDDAWMAAGPPLNTVAMEFSPPPGGGDPFIKFYTFDGQGNRVVSADLDGRGEKLQPELCTPCHGGRTSPLENGVYPDNGDIGAHFVPFDLDSFRYSTSNADYSREAQEAQLRLFNRGVVAANPGEAALELVRGWYGGPMLEGDFDGTFVPPGWLPPLAPAGAATLYTDVVRRVCRGCHIQLDARVPGFGFTTFAQFEGARSQITRLVCDEGAMPRALRTFDKFWLGTDGHQPTALGDFLDGDIVWSPSPDPSAPDVRRVAIDPVQPSTVYALTLDDVLRSIDGGGSWASITNGLPKGGDGALAIVPLELAVDPRTPATLFLAGDGLFRSVDGGGTWTPLRDGFFTDLVAVDDRGSEKTLIFAVDRVAGEVLKSDDGGATWDVTLTGPVLAVAVDPVTPTTEYYALPSGLVKRVAGVGADINDNGGVPSNGVVDFLAVDPVDPTIVYATFVAGSSTEPLAQRNGTFRSTDRGVTFTFFAPFRVEPDRFRSGVLWGFPLGGLARSVDRGLSWHLLLDEATGVEDVGGADRRTVYAATKGGVLRGAKLSCGQRGPGHPVASASALRTVEPGTSVALNGGASLPGTGITWEWSLRGRPSGSSAEIESPASATTEFTADVLGAYLVGLTVRQGDVASVPALVPVIAATTPISFRGDIEPILEVCGGCHVSGNPMDLSGNADSDFSAVHPRVNEGDPPASLLLRKPQGLDAHPGGEIAGFDLDGDQDGDRSRYDLILRWIDEGANDN